MPAKGTGSEPHKQCCKAGRQRAPEATRGSEATRASQREGAVVDRGCDIGVCRVAPARGSKHLLSAQPEGPGLAQAREVTGPV
eukprot:scaffold95922_cov61-Phaeocystis_antarctica.AAC.2